MRKTDKKIENALRQTLTEVCEVALERYEGFKWLTHVVNYDHFPGSLSVICVFEENKDLSLLYKTGKDSDFQSLIIESLLSINIRTKDIRTLVRFDTEENCSIENGGKWHERFR